MISEGQFHTEFEKIEASFARSFSDKIKDGWYREVENCEPQPFKRTMRKLALGDKLPHFGHFWIEYRIAKQNMEGGGEIQRGCADCRAGYIHHIQGEHEVVSHCRVCWPESSIGADPKTARRYVDGMEPWEHNRAVLIPRETASVMIKELQDKLFKKDVDWDELTKDAWALHEKAAA